MWGKGKEEERTRKRTKKRGKIKGKTGREGRDEEGQVKRGQEVGEWKPYFPRQLT